ncbi:MAG: hypothetical protein J2P36_39230, partial [Ktedonobacteraceae bacterium]|nr:hypothetical protein [Ktedonobacteraceae bacterium]
MRLREYILSIKIQGWPLWRRYLLDSVLAMGGALAITGVIYTFGLYPPIPNISIVYLVIVLALA